MNALRAGAVAAGTTLLMLLMSSPALALTREQGDDPGSGLSVYQTVGLFVLIPLGAFGIISGLVITFDKSRKPDAYTTVTKPKKPKAEKAKA